MKTILSLLAVSALTLASSHEPKRHSKRRGNDLQIRNETLVPRGDVYTGTGTYFYVGLGACGQWSQDSDMMVALNWQQYGGGYPGPMCFKSITIQANGQTVSGVQILDECPSCPGYGDLDLSPGLFQRFADLSAGVVSITWWYEDGSGGGGNQASSTTQWTQTSSSAAWTPSPSASSSTSAWTSPTSTSTWTSTSSASYSSSTNTTSTSTSTSRSVNPFAVVSNYNTSTTATSSTSSASGSSTASVTGTDQSQQVSSTGQQPVGNLEMFNGVVTNYGQLIVVAAGGSSP